MGWARDAFNRASFLAVLTIATTGTALAQKSDNKKADEINHPVELNEIRLVEPSVLVDSTYPWFNDARYLLELDRIANNTNSTRQQIQNTYEGDIATYQAQEKIKKLGIFQRLLGVTGAIADKMLTTFENVKNDNNADTRLKWRWSIYDAVKVSQLLVELRKIDVYYNGVYAKREGTYKSQMLAQDKWVNDQLYAQDKTFMNKPEYKGWAQAMSEEKMESMLNRSYQAAYQQSAQKQVEQNAQQQGANDYSNYGKKAPSPK